MSRKRRNSTDDPSQCYLLAERKPNFVPPYRLRAGDVVQYENQPCRVIRVSDCAAVIAITKPLKEFTTLFGKKVRIQPKPALVRISSNSECVILRRAPKSTDNMLAR